MARAGGFWRRQAAGWPGARRRLALLGLVLVAAGVGACMGMIRMPGRSHRGPLPPLDDQGARLARALRADVEILAGAIGERNMHRYGQLLRAADFVQESLEGSGYRVERQVLQAEGRPVHNLEASLGSGPEIVIVGAHYDSVLGCPGANDNGSGVAALLALARRLAGRSPARTLRFVAFVNEEPPYFQSQQMGSRAYAARCRQRQEKICAMLSLETIGYYDDRPGSQQYPAPLGLFYPSQGNFVAFVGNVASRALVARSLATFRQAAAFPSEGAALPSAIPGVGWSDQWSFWQEGYPALMVTDTAPFRYPYYHTAEDTPDKLDYERLARVVAGLEKVVEDLLTP